MRTSYEFIVDRFEQVFYSIKSSKDNLEIKAGKLTTLAEALQSLEIRAEYANQHSLVQRIRTNKERALAAANDILNTRPTQAL